MGSMKAVTCSKIVPVAIIVRVSTNKQETQRQRHELEAVARSKGWQVVEVCEETVSGSADIQDRPAALQRVLPARPGWGGLSRKC